MRIWLAVSFLNLMVDLVVRVQITHQTWHVFLLGNVIANVKRHLKFCKISGDIAVKNGQGCSSLEQVSNNCHIMLCF